MALSALYKTAKIKTQREIISPEPEGSPAVPLGIMV